MIAVLRQSGLFRTLVVKREFLIYAALLAIALPLAFYNLDRSPRTWQDEGGTLLIARTLVEDGVYAIRTSDGYQTFGSIQSVGPTVILPLALSYKLFGIGLLQGRAVMAVWLVLSIIAFYSLGRELFGTRTALLAILLLLSFPSGILMLGRQALGEVPALGLMLFGCVMWLRAIRTNKYQYYAITGLLFGLAAVTKSQFVPMILGMLGICSALNLWLYKRSWLPIILIGFITGMCVSAWIGWQILYFGLPTFQENASKMNDLAKVTIGINRSNTIIALKYIIGPDSNHFFYFFGLPSTIYAIIYLSQNKADKNTIVVAALTVFMLMCLAYYTFWIIPVPIYAFAPTAVAALFVAKLWNDIATNLGTLSPAIRSDNIKDASTTAALRITLALTIVILLSFSIGSEIKDNVLSNDTRPQQIASFLKENVPSTAVVETWEREIGILTNHTYHYPDQILLKETQGKIFRGIDYNYVLGSDYFQKVKPNYLVIGWYARHTQLYDTAYLTNHSCILSTFGDDDWRYEVYRVDTVHFQNNTSNQIQSCTS